MSAVRDTLNRPVAEGGVWITLRADSPSGVSLGGRETINPGETKRVAAHIALRLIHNGRASRAAAPAVVASEGQTRSTPSAIPPDTGPAKPRKK